MHRLATLSLCALVPLSHGASHAHADLDLQFANMTELDIETFTFSVDVLLTGSESDPPISAYGLVVATSGMSVTSIRNLSPISYLVWEEYEKADDTYLVAGYDSIGTIDPGPEPAGLFQLDLEVTQSSGPFTIDLFAFTFRDHEGEVIPTGQESYTLTIPVPATLALSACGFGGVRRRRVG